LLRRFVDAQVSLMHDEQIHVVHLQTVTLENFLSDLRHEPYRQTEDLSTAL
jgi:hypothetical protein